MSAITTPEHRQAALAIRELLAVYREHADLISIGAYRQGTNPAVDAAIAMHDEINRYLKQRIDEPCSFQAAEQDLLRLAARCLSARTSGRNVIPSKAPASAGVR
jgi:flagellum-specific ATP synthase